MSRIIKSSTPGKDREKLSKAILVTIRDFMLQEAPDQSTRDMVAFVILALNEIETGIDLSVAAWEKRGYWVKADKYRLEWQWAGKLAQKLQKALFNEKWDEVAGIFLEIMRKFSNIKISSQHRMGKPWINASKTFEELVK